MKGINKYAWVLFMFLLLSACKKNEEKPFTPILKNGYYYLESFDTPSIRQRYFFYLSKDDFYPASIMPTDSICYSKIAGSVQKTGDVISIPFLKPSHQSSICSFYGDNYYYYLVDLKFNQDQNFPEFSGKLIKGSGADTVYCELVWLKE